MLGWFALYALIINPVIVGVGLTVCYRVFGMDTANAAWSPDPLAPFLLVRLFWIPFFLAPFLILFSLVRHWKKTWVNKQKSI